jgi:hypothetical protein
VSKGARHSAPAGAEAKLRLQHPSVISLNRQNSVSRFFTQLSGWDMPVFSSKISADGLSLPPAKSRKFLPAFLAFLPPSTGYLRINIFFSQVVKKSHPAVVTMCRKFQNSFHLVSHLLTYAHVFLKLFPGIVKKSHLAMLRTTSPAGMQIRGLKSKRSSLHRSR